MAEHRYRIIGHGSDLTIEARGADLGSCLDAAVAGFAASLAEVAGDLPRQRREVTVASEAPADLLVELFEELITLLDVEGLLAVGLSGLRDAGGRWEADLEVVALDRLDVHGVAPKAATWHRARLDEAAQGWHGRLTLDL